MSESIGLISWDEVENKGKIPDSEWVSPQVSHSELDELFQVTEANGGIVTDENVIRYAAGRRRHLNRLEYPEGYHATEVVDSETGEKLTTEKDIHAYWHERPNPSHDYPGRCGFQNFLNKLLPVSDDPEENRVIRYVNASKDRGTYTLVGSKDSGGYGSSRGGELSITPESRSLHIESQGRVADGVVADSLDDSMLRSGLTIIETPDGIRMETFLALPDYRGGYYDLRFVWDAANQTSDISGHEEPNILDALGIEHAGRITTSLALDALCKAAGMKGRPDTIDLAATAQKFYEHIGDPHIVPLAMIQGK